MVWNCSICVISIRAVINTFSIGDIVYWDEGTNTATSTSGYSEATIGKAVKAAVSGDSTVRVKLIPNIS